jgi:hypothetical protein
MGSPAGVENTFPCLEIFQGDPHYIQGHVHYRIFTESVAALLQLRRRVVGASFRGNGVPASYFLGSVLRSSRCACQGAAGWRIFCFINRIAKLIDKINLKRIPDAIELSDYYLGCNLNC